MRLSESLRRGIMKSTVGGIINKFKVGTSRRDTLFFEELLAEYIYECEKKGFGEETRKMGEEWGFLIVDKLFPDTVKKIPPVFLINVVLKSVWHNLGMIDDIHIERSNRTLVVTTKNEPITRFIGANTISVGFYMGALEALFNSSMQPLGAKQNKESCEYAFVLNGTPTSIDGRKKEQYARLNNFGQVAGYTLKDALKRGTFSIKGNAICFRGRCISPIENTIFHILGKANILPEKIAEISYNFFKEIVKEEAGKKEKLSLLKTLFQIMGWGIIKILIKKDGGILIGIRNPPHGLLPEDEYGYIARTFLGYLWLVDKKLKAVDVKKTGKHLLMDYSY